MITVISPEGTTGLANLKDLKILKMAGFRVAVLSCNYKLLPTKNKFRVV